MEISVTPGLRGSNWALAKRVPAENLSVFVVILPTVVFELATSTSTHIPPRTAWPNPTLSSVRLLRKTARSWTTLFEEPAVVVNDGDQMTKPEGNKFTLLLSVA